MTSTTDQLAPWSYVAGVCVAIVVVPVLLLLAINYLDRRIR